MDEDTTWRVIAQERRSLADLLDSLTPAQWETPSLAVGWRVQDVAAHLTSVGSPPSPTTMLLEGVRARGNFHRLNHDYAVRRAARPTSALVADLRDHADSRKVPVVTNYHNVLFDILVHGQDIAVPLGFTRAMPLEAARAGAERVWAMGWPFWAKRRLRGMRLVATDVAWAAGSGDEVRGPIGALLLLLTGRPAALGALSGSSGFADVLGARLH